MAERHRDLDGVDLPEPEDVLSGDAVHTRDHEPSDLDDREVPLDDPDEPDPPLDDRDLDAEDAAAGG
jgi:hypothetical protein